MKIDIQNKQIKFETISIENLYIKSGNTSYPIYCEEFSIQNLYPGKYILSRKKGARILPIGNMNLTEPVVIETFYKDDFGKLRDTFVHIYKSRKKRIIIDVSYKLKTESHVQFIKKVDCGNYSKVFFKLDNISEREKQISFFVRERATFKTYQLEQKENYVIINYPNYEVGIYDFFAMFDVCGYSVEKRVFKVFRDVHYKIKSPYCEINDMVYFAGYHCTFKAGFLALTNGKVASECINVFSSARKSRNNVLLICEQQDKANDNGFALFQYIRNTYPEFPAFYVLREESDALDKVSQYGNVLKFGTVEYFKKIKEATHIACTHHPQYILPVNHKYFNKVLQKKHITFLQHGVMGMKYMADLYGNRLKTFDVDTFIVSSEKEKSYIVKDFNYPKKSVKVTGLARFDNLLSNDVDLEKNSIIVIPTWRDFLISKNRDEFVKTSYFINWTQLINNLSKRYDGKKIYVYLHVNMKKFQDLFNNDDIYLLENNCDLQTYLKRAEVMITDYSSVGFDFSFLGKQVVYYQFDLKRFLGKHGSHINVKKDLPGFVCKSQLKVLEFLDQFFDNENKVESIYNQKSDAFIYSKSVNFCERNFEAILKSKKMYFKWYKFLNLKPIIKAKINRILKYR